MTFLDRMELALGRAEYVALTRIAARLTGFRTDVARLGGVSVPFLIRGWGVPVFLIHGFGGDKESWLLMARLLQARRTIVIPDLPGFGAAEAIPAERASAKAQAATLARLMDHLGFARGHLVGNSMGGGISLRFAKDYPRRASSMTLIGSVAPVVEVSEVGRALDGGENPLIVADPNSLDALVSLVTERAPPSTKAIRRYLASDRYARRDAHADLFRGWVLPEEGDGVPLDLESIDTPALVIHGAQDRVIHPATGRGLAERLPHARLEMMEGIGHVPQMEAPSEVAAWVDAFVSGVERQREGAATHAA